MALFTPIRDRTPSMASEIKIDAAGGPRSVDEFEIVSDISSAVVHAKKDTKNAGMITSPPN